MQVKFIQIVFLLSLLLLLQGHPTTYTEELLCNSVGKV